MDIPEDVLRVAFRLPPEKAQAYLEKKGYTFGWSFREVSAQAHAHAFTVAKAMRRDVLESIRQMVDRAVSEGITFDKFQKSLEPYLKLAGWWGRTWPQDSEGRYLDENGKPFPIGADGTPLIPAGARPPLLGSPHRLRTIYEQNLQTALNVGHYQSQLEYVEDRPYWQYLSVMDSRTGNLCRRLSNVIYRYDDPFWQHMYPPNHWRCRARVTTLDDDDVERRGLTVSTSEGNLTVTTGPGGQPVATINYGGERYSTNEGFAFNPGRAALTPFVPAMVPGSNWRSDEDRNAGRAGASDATPWKDVPKKSVTGFIPEDAATWSAERAAREFLSALGAEDGAQTVLTNKLGDAVAVGEEMVRDARTGAFLAPAGSPRYARLVADTITDPGEIWFDWITVDGRSRLVERYVSRWSTNAATVVQFTGKGWNARAIAADDAETALGALRTGRLMYYRGQKK